MSCKIVGIGELLWDLLPAGRQLGGAPANFTYHAAALGAAANLITRVGQDDLGREAQERLRAKGVPLTYVQSDSFAPTGTVAVEIAADGQPHFTIHEQVAWDRIALEPAAHAAVAQAHAVCFGTLAQRSEPSRSSIRSLVAAAPVTALRILDVNLRQHYYSPTLIQESLALANVLKVNDAELALLAGMFNLPGNERAQVARLAERFGLRLVTVTRGSRGSLLYAEGCWSDRPGSPAEVVDTVGAGDSFTAAMTIGLLAGWSLDRVNEHANEIAAYVCSCPGAMPPLPEALRAPFASACSERSRTLEAPPIPL